MNIVCACDANFIAHLATMLLSFVENNERHRTRIFVLCDGSLTGREKLAVMFDRHRVDLSLISIEDSFLQGLFVSYHIARVAYARLLMGELLPPEIDRVIYLDCDLIIRGDLSDLWNVNLEGKTVVAVREVTDYIWHSKLGLPPGAPYFNNGVMLIDLDRWRKF
jgi:lipopolysaccharide biosynthesis glycosyltransferase